MDDEESDDSSCGSDRQEWDSPTKDIDLTASEDILGYEDDAHNSNQLQYSQTSSCSNRSEGTSIKHPCLHILSLYRKTAGRDHETSHGRQHLQYKNARHAKPNSPLQDNH